MSFTSCPFSRGNFEDAKYTPKAVYTILGVGLNGKKEILGLYLLENEGANFWLQVLTDLSNRGVQDILIASIDGLKGFPEAIKAIFIIQFYELLNHLKKAYL